MKLILKKDVKNVGKAGDQVSVKKGFARNFLIPQGLALLADQGRVKVWKHQQTIIKAKKKQAVLERKVLIDKLAEINLHFEKEAQKNDKLFGSVSSHEIAQALEKIHGIHVDKRDIHFSELKSLGDHVVKVRLDSEHETELKLHIKKKEEKKREEKSPTKSFLDKASQVFSKEASSSKTEEAPAKTPPKTKAQPDEDLKSKELNKEKSPPQEKKLSPAPPAVEEDEDFEDEDIKTADLVPFKEGFQVFDEAVTPDKPADLKSTKEPEQKETDKSEPALNKKAKKPSLFKSLFGKKD